MNRLLRYPLALVTMGLCAMALMPSSAQAYPEFIAKGYTNCGTCHYSPTGGGMANSYGHATREATFPDSVNVAFFESLRESLAKNDVLGIDDDDNPAFQWDIGFESRMLLTQGYSDPNASKGLLFIPMLAELSAVTAYGPVFAFGSISPIRSGAERVPDRVFSREHWLMYRFDDNTSLRAGRMMLPFGLRVPDHTLFTREALGFDKYGQDYALQLDRATESYLASLALYAGDMLLDPAVLREKGAALSFSYNLASRAALGVSALGGFTQTSSRYAGALFGRVRFLERGYVLTEINQEIRSAKSGDAEQTTRNAMVRVGAFLLDSLDLHIEWSTTLDVSADELARSRYRAGMLWKILPWVEFDISALVEEHAINDRSFNTLAQIHLTY